MAKIYSLQQRDYINNYYQRELQDKELILSFKESALLGFGCCILKGRSIPVCYNLEYTDITLKTCTTYSMEQNRRLSFTTATPQQIYISRRIRWTTPLCNVALFYLKSPVCGHKPMSFRELLYVHMPELRINHSCILTRDDMDGMTYKLQDGLSWVLFLVYFLNNHNLLPRYKTIYFDKFVSYMLKAGQLTTGVREHCRSVIISKQIICYVTALIRKSTVQ